MPNLGRVLKDEIVRLARREIRSQTTTLHKASAGYRREIAALKRRVAELDRAAKGWAKQSQRSAGAVSPAVSSDKPLRFRADGFQTLRKKLGVSAEQMGMLIGVSGQSIYGWEQKRTTPRRSQLPAIAALRGLGKREIAQRLDALKKTSSKKRRG